MWNLRWVAGMAGVIWCAATVTAQAAEQTIPPSRSMSDRSEQAQSSMGAAARTAASTVGTATSGMVDRLAAVDQSMRQATTKPKDDEMVIFDFEGSTQDWAIPDWAQTSSDYSAKKIGISQDFAARGKSSLLVMADFPGGKWSGAYVEQLMYVTDWSPFGSIAADVYVPYNAPKSLKSRFILTVGDQWTWTEMNRGFQLEPGKWTTIRANLKPGSLDWKFFPTDAFRKDIRKVGIRVESEKDGIYSGPIFVDNVRLAP